MQRRDFMLAAAAAGGLAITGCASAALVTEPARKERRRDIDMQFYATLERLYMTVQDVRELLAKARGVLVFSTVIATGAANGEQYGEGALRVANAMDRYYSVTSTSAGLRAEAQPNAIVLLFMTQEVLDNFRNSKDWFAGVDASVAVLKTAANGNVDPRSMTADVLAFVLTGNNLMTNLTLDGAKISPLDI
jgi:lipid-binding SYLF domain-containing protein